MAETSNNADAPARDTAGARLAAKRAAKAAKKAAARGTQTPVEEVASTMAFATSWLDENRQTLIIAAAAVLAACVAWFAWTRHATGVEREAGALLRTAITTTQGFVTAGDEAAPEDLLVPTFSSSQERDKQALAQFREVGKKFPDSNAAVWAKLGEANALLDMGQPADATRAFAQALDHARDDAYLRARALEGLGYALEADKKETEALKRFEELSKLDNGAYVILGDYQRGRVLAKLGQREQAVKVLEAMLKAVAEKPAEGGERYASVTEQAQTLLTELGGQAPQKAPDLSAIGAGAGDNAITQQVMEALRKQIAEKKQGTSGK